MKKQFKYKFFTITVPSSFIDYLIKIGIPLKKYEMPLYDIPKNPTIPLTELSKERFNLIDRSQQVAKDQYKNNLNNHDRKI